MNNKNKTCSELSIYSQIIIKLSFTLGYNKIYKIYDRHEIRLFDFVGTRYKYLLSHVSKTR